MAYVRTIGTHVTVSGRGPNPESKTVTLSNEQATRDVEVRNQRAKELGIKTRYEAILDPEYRSAR